MIQNPMTPEHALSLMEADGVPRIAAIQSEDMDWAVSQSVAAWLDAKGVPDLVVYVTRVDNDNAPCVRLKLIRSEEDWSARDYVLA